MKAMKAMLLEHLGKNEGNESNAIRTFHDLSTGL